MILHVIFIL